MYSIFQILNLLISVLWFFVIAHVIMSWLVNFQVLNIRQPLVSQVWNALQRIVQPIYAPIRKFIGRLVPNVGGMDFSPLVVILVLAAIRIILRNNEAAFY